MPWVPMQRGTKDRMQRELRRNKKIMSDLEIIKRVPNCFRKFYWLVRYIAYDQEPDYRAIIEELNELQERLVLSPRLDLEEISKEISEEIPSSFMNAS